MGAYLALAEPPEKPSSSEAGFTSVPARVLAILSVRMVGFAQGRFGAEDATASFASSVQGGGGLHVHGVSPMRKWRKVLSTPNGAWSSVASSTIAAGVFMVFLLEVVDSFKFAENTSHKIKANNHNADNHNFGYYRKEWFSIFAFPMELVACPATIQGV